MREEIVPAAPNKPITDAEIVEVRGLITGILGFVTLAGHVFYPEMFAVGAWVSPPAAVEDIAPVAAAGPPRGLSFGVQF